MKEIQLSKGLVALVDDEDYAMLAKHKWSTVSHADGRRYAARRTYGAVKAYVYMHHVIMGRKWIDHIDGNGLNNQRANLRFTDDRLNQGNARKRKGTTSKFKGVSRFRTGRWVAYIKDNKKHTHLGYHDTEEQAARAYDQAARRVFGDHARLNFPETLP